MCLDPLRFPSCLHDTCGAARRRSDGIRGRQVRQRGVCFGEGEQARQGQRAVPHLSRGQLARERPAGMHDSAMLDTIVSFACVTVGGGRGGVPRRLMDDIFDKILW